MKNVDPTYSDYVKLRRLRRPPIGALNGMLEWFDPQKGGAQSPADDYADFFLHGIPNQTGDDT